MLQSNRLLKLKNTLKSDKLKASRRIRIDHYMQDDVILYSYFHDGLSIDDLCFYWSKYFDNFSILTFFWQKLETQFDRENFSLSNCIGFIFGPLNFFKVHLILIGLTHYALSALSAY